MRSHRAAATLSAFFLIEAAFSFCFFPLMVSAQELYRWVDEKGSVHFTDSLHSIPGKYRDQTEKRRPLAPTREPSISEQSEPLSKSQRIVVPYTREDNAIIVEGTINGSGSVKFILDTGASGTQIPLSIAQRLGIDDKRGLFVPTVGVGGMVIVPYVEIDSLRVGGAEVRNLQVGLQDLPGREGIGLLGMDFLSQFRFNVDQVKNQLTLESEPGAYEGRSLQVWQTNFRFWQSLKKRIETFLSSAQSPQFKSGAQETLESVNRKLNDLELRASQAGVPREFRQ